LTEEARELAWGDCVPACSGKKINERDLLEVGTECRKAPPQWGKRQKEGVRKKVVHTSGFKRCPQKTQTVSFEHAHDKLNFRRLEYRGNKGGGPVKKLNGRRAVKPERRR